MDRCTHIYSYYLFILDRYEIRTSQDSRLFGPRPSNILAATCEKKGSWATQTLAKVLWAGILLWRPGVGKVRWRWSGRRRRCSWNQASITRCTSSPYILFILDRSQVYIHLCPCPTETSASTAIVVLYIYIYIYIYVCVYIYIYICIDQVHHEMRKMRRALLLRTPLALTAKNKTYHCYYCYCYCYCYHYYHY